MSNKNTKLKPSEAVKNTDCISTWKSVVGQTSSTLIVSEKEHERTVVPTNFEAPFFAAEHKFTGLHSRFIWLQSGE